MTLSYGKQTVAHFKPGSFADDNPLASKEVSSPDPGLLKSQLDDISLKQSKKNKQKIIEIGKGKLDDSMMSYVWNERNKQLNLQVNSLTSQHQDNLDYELTNRKKNYQIGSHKASDKQGPRKNSQLSEKVCIKEGTMLDHDLGPLEVLKLDDLGKAKPPFLGTSRDEIDPGQRRSKYRSTQIDASDIVKNSWLMRVDEFEVEPDSPCASLKKGGVTGNLDRPKGSEGKFESNFDEKKLDDLEELQMLLLNELMQDLNPPNDNKAQALNEENNSAKDHEIAQENEVIKLPNKSMTSANDEKKETLSELSRLQKILIEDMMNDIRLDNSKIGHSKESAKSNNEEKGSKVNDVEIFSVGTPMVDIKEQFFSKQNRPLSSDTGGRAREEHSPDIKVYKRPSAQPNLLGEQVKMLTKREIQPFLDFNQSIKPEKKDLKILSTFQLENMNQHIKKEVEDSDADSVVDGAEKVNQGKDDSKSIKFAENEPSFKHNSSNKTESLPVFGKIISHGGRVRKTSTNKMIDSPLKKTPNSNSFRRENSSNNVLITQSIKEGGVTPSCADIGSNSHNKKSQFEKPPVKIHSAQERRLSKMSNGKSPTSLFSTVQLCGSLKKESGDLKSPGQGNIKEKRPHKLQLIDDNSDRNLNILSEAKQKASKSLRPYESVKRSARKFGGVPSAKRQKQFSFKANNKDSSSSSDENECKNSKPAPIQSKQEFHEQDTKPVKPPKAAIVTIPEIVINSECRSPGLRYKS